jgi:hypothetical protein
MRPLGAAVLALALAPLAASAAEPFGPGESVAFKISYAHLVAGRARLTVSGVEQAGLELLEFVSTARSEGFFAWLFGFRVRDQTIARWNPGTGCSVRIEKTLREGRAARDQVVEFDGHGHANVRDKKIKETQFDVDPCALDVLSALFVARRRGIPKDKPLELPVFDNGKKFRLAVQYVESDQLDLPAPFGKKAPVIVVEPRLVEGTGLFVKEKGARLKVWLTDDARHVPVKMASKVAVGSVTAEMESYEPPYASAEGTTAP